MRVIGGMKRGPRLCADRCKAVDPCVVLKISIATSSSNSTRKRRPAFRYGAAWHKSVTVYKDQKCVCSFLLSWVWTVSLRIAMIG